MSNGFPAAARRWAGSARSSRQGGPVRAGSDSLRRQWRRRASCRVRTAAVLRGGGCWSGSRRAPPLSACRRLPPARLDPGQPGSRASSVGPRTGCPRRRGPVAMPSRPPSVPMPVGRSHPGDLAEGGLFVSLSGGLPGDLGGVSLCRRGRRPPPRESQSPGRVEVVRDRAHHLATFRGPGRGECGRSGGGGRGRGEERRWWSSGGGGVSGRARTPARRPADSHQRLTPVTAATARPEKRSGTVSLITTGPIVPGNAVCVGWAASGRGQEAQSPRAHGRDDPQPSPVQWRILGVTLAVGFMALLDNAIVTPSDPISMQAGLGDDHVDHPGGRVRVASRSSRRWSQAADWVTCTGDGALMMIGLTGLSPRGQSPPLPSSRRRPRAGDRGPRGSRGCPPRPLL